MLTHPWRNTSFACFVLITLSTALNRMTLAIIARYQRASSGLGTIVASLSRAVMKAAKFFSPAMATCLGLQRHASWYLAISFLVSLRFGGIISFRCRLFAGVVPSLSNMTL